MFLITGHPRSGTGYMAALCQKAGLSVGHEILGKDGISSWLHIGEGAVSWLETDVEKREYDKIIHIVRNPLDVIASCQTLSDDTFDFIFSNIGHPGGERGLSWYMWTWLKWNTFIEKNAKWIFRVEDLRKDCSELERFLVVVNGKMPEIYPPENTNSRFHKPLTWYDLEQADPILCECVQQKAIEYGYKIFTFGAIMMAKNEAHNLDRCLKSIRPYVDEIILVDTGSTDNTMEIAKSYGAKVYEHPWEHNFSLHRNQSINYSTCDWMLLIDCDEELIGDGWILRKFVNDVHINSDFNAAAMLIKDIHKGESDMQFNAARLFRRGTVHFEDIVHNRPVYDGSAIMPIGDQVFWLHHYGYDLEPEQKLAKINRTKTLLEKRIHENPEDWGAYFYLSQTCGELGLDQEVLNHCETYINNKDKIENFNRSVYYTHLQAISIIEGHTSKYLEDTLNKYMNELPKDLDITFFALLHAKETEKKLLLHQSAIRFIGIYNSYINDPHLQSGRFTYNFKPECLSLALFYNAILSIEIGAKALADFATVIDKTDQDFKSRAILDMQIAMKNLGVTWTHNPQNTGVQNGV